MASEHVPGDLLGVKLVINLGGTHLGHDMSARLASPAAVHADGGVLDVIVTAVDDLDQARIAERLSAR